METILSQISLFCEKEIVPFLSESKGHPGYPSKIIKSMGEIGLFGINIPEQYGGSKLPISLNLEINRILSRYWLSIPALYGTHLRANQYFLELANDSQKRNYLPDMASGKQIASHAFHEKGIKNPLLFSTQIEQKKGEFYLSGDKEWVTNAFDSDFMIVVAKRINSTSDEGPHCSAVVVKKDAKGVYLSDEHFRRGIEGVSIRRVSFNDVFVSEDNFIGGSRTCALNFINKFRVVSSLNFAARCVGLAESIVELVHPYLMIKQRDNFAQGVMFYKWSEIQMIKESIISYFEKSVSLNADGNLTKAQAHRTKVFCSQELQELVSRARMLTGGTGFASDDHQLIRQLNDAGSLALIDTPDDILLTWSGKEELDG